MLLDDFRHDHFLRVPGQTDAEHRAVIEAGLVRLERVVDLLDAEDVAAGSRAWAHFWRAQFYRRLDRPDDAEREIEITLELDPDFYRSPFFDWARRTRHEARRRPRR